MYGDEEDEARTRADEEEAEAERALDERNDEMQRIDDGDATESDVANNYPGTR
jgi:hypothetical protein